MGAFLAVFCSIVTHSHNCILFAEFYYVVLCFSCMCGPIVFLALFCVYVPLFFGIVASWSSCIGGSVIQLLRKIGGTAQIGILMANRLYHSSVISCSSTCSHRSLFEVLMHWPLRTQSIKMTPSNSSSSCRSSVSSILKLPRFLSTGLCSSPAFKVPSRSCMTSGVL